ncbi:MAG: hypothetical protein IKK74_11700 [Clostridia bacterium]|nr:hypothetical protein [Clostridia bacterium]
MDETIDLITEEVLAEEANTVEPDLHTELDDLRAKLEKAERAAREITEGWREFTELYPDADISTLPDSFNAALERGIPPAAAYALELRRREVEQIKIARADRKAREQSFGRIESAEDSLYSPAEVRAMKPAEVRKNIEKIRRSMKSWH